MDRVRSFRGLAQRLRMSVPLPNACRPWPGWVEDTHHDQVALSCRERRATQQPSLQTRGWMGGCCLPGIGSLGDRPYYRPGSLETPLRCARPLLRSRGGRRLPTRHRRAPTPQRLPEASLPASRRASTMGSTSVYRAGSCMLTCSHGAATRHRSGNGAAHANVPPPTRGLGLLRPVAAVRAAAARVLRRSADETH